MKLRRFEKNQDFESLAESFKSSNDFINQNIRFSKRKVDLNFKKILIFYNYVHFATQYMIKIEISQIMKLDKRFPTLQKWVKSKAWCKRYCTLKFFAHQIQRTPPSPHPSCLMSDKSERNLKWPPLLEIAPKIDAKMINSLSTSAIGSITCPTDEDLLQVYVTYLTAWCRAFALLTARAY